MSDNDHSVIDFETLTGKTEESVLFNDADFVRFGGRTFEIKRPSIRKAREWRRKILEMDLELQKEAKRTEKLRESGDDPNQVELLIYVNDTHLQKMAAVVLGYCPENGLTAEIIENEGTDAELIDAYMKVLKHGRLPLERLNPN